MGFYGNSPMVTNGIVLYFDIGNYKSYTPSGATTNNLISLSNNGDILGGVTYDTSFDGNLVFNGVDGYINCGNSDDLKITKGSYSAWFRGTQQGATYNGILVKRNVWGCFIYQSNLALYDWGNNIGRSTSVDVSDNQWRNVCVTFDEITGSPSNNTIVYINGDPVLTTTIKLSAQDNPLTIGYGNFSGQYFSGSVSNVQVYNRILTPNEVKQNYDALKTRFQN